MWCGCEREPACARAPRAALPCWPRGGGADPAAARCSAVPLHQLGCAEGKGGEERDGSALREEGEVAAVLAGAVCGEVKKVLEVRRAAASACRGEPAAAGAGRSRRPGGPWGLLYLGGGGGEEGGGSLPAFLKKKKKAWKGVVIHPETYSPVSDGGGCCRGREEAAEAVAAGAGGGAAPAAGGRGAEAPAGLAGRSLPRAVPYHRPSRRTRLLPAAGLEAAVEAVARYDTSV